MQTQAPIKEGSETIPHDPRNEPIPEPSQGDDQRTSEKSEKEARQEEGVAMKAKEDIRRNNDRQAPPLSENSVLIKDENILPTGIQTGQTTRGAYSTDTSTGAGRYADHRAGTFGVDDVAQPGNDEEVEPDPIDPKF